MLDFEKLPRFKSQSFEILEFIPKWAQTFEVDDKAIIRQLSWAHGWCDTNPKKAPKSNIKRFLYNWMVRAKKMGTLASVERRVNYREVVPPEDELPGPEDFAMMKEALKKR